MLNKKLQADHWNEMCYQLLKLYKEGKRVGLLGLKDFKMILRVTTAQLQLLSDYYYWKDYADRDGGSRRIGEQEYFNEVKY
ncbi:hypothetical protein Tco_0290767 [Tanacetum coccineum]